eukprot:GEMP01030282.1.p1 GENE.GEMP01030282.1~~GEMP01030282.1.p1  ORF type:complete len:434 (+),score=78.84 GEMP01030282.1:335-1636(+)
MVMLIPKSIAGFNLDSLFAYETRQLVRIEDRNLGCLYYALLLFIVSWVLGFQIFFGNEHFQLFDVKGTARMTIQQPTEGCNPNNNDCKDAYTPFTELPYCLEYTGDKSRIPSALRQQKCKFADQHEMAPEGMLGDGIFVPTRIDMHIEKTACSPGPENGWSCDKSYKVEVMKENVYVADVEDYTLLFVHSYYRGDIMGNSLYHQGYYEECRNTTSGKIIATRPCKGRSSLIPIRCITGDCVFHVRENAAFLSVGDKKRSSRKQMSLANDGPGDVFAIGSGDVFKISKVLELAGLDLDFKLNTAGEPYREAGTVVEIQVDYNNLHPWSSTFGDLEVGYIYRVIERPMEEMKTEMFSQKQPADFPVHRWIENRHGIMMRVTVGGTFGYFNVVYLLVMITTSLALLAGAQKVVDLLALYCLKRREEYRAFKYKVVS